MTIVVFDGKTLAADRAAVINGVKYEVSKLEWDNQDHEAVTGTGDPALIMLLRDWYYDGAKPDDYPLHLGTAALIVVKKHAGLTLYRSRYPEDYGFSKVAFGSGLQYAVGALAMGATAEQAALVACQYDPSCGHGVDVVDLDVL